MWGISKEYFGGEVLERKPEIRMRVDRTRGEALLFFSARALSLALSRSRSLARALSLSR